jgi:hypothetical protein
MQRASYKRCQIILTYESLCIIQKVAVVLSEIFFYLLKARFEGWQSSLAHAVFHDCPGCIDGSRFH